MPSSISISVAGKAAFYRAVWINNVPPQDNNELKAELKALPGMIKVSPNFGDPRLYVVSGANPGVFQEVRLHRDPRPLEAAGRKEQAWIST
jgi:hypothetical protein